jgi:GNAT superfamily N-acetyltransferase
MERKDIEITNPTEDELETTLCFAFQHLSSNELPLRIEAVMQQHQSGQIDLTGIFQAKYENLLIGALYAQCRPDGSVMCWVPTMEHGFPLKPILESLMQFCRSKNAFAAVALADRHQSFDEPTFCAAGQFRFLSDLIHLAVEIAPSDSHAQQHRLQFVPLSDYSSKTAERLTRLVKITYQHSLDFPDLMQIAPVEAVLHGYQTGSLFRPELWFFIQHEGNDVGALLLTDISAEQFELTYMGLIESARGQGFSHDIVSFAKAIACRWNRTLLLTAADAQNVPACQSYLAQGFRAWDRKKVYARFF